MAHEVVDGDEDRDGDRDGDGDDRGAGDEDGAAWPPAALSARLAFLLKHALARLVHLGEAALVPLGVDGREFGLLSYVAGEGAVSQQEASRRLGIDRTTMVALIDGLQAKGLVERRPDPRDRRKNHVSLTAAGATTLTAATDAIEDAESRFLVPLPAAEAASVRRALRTLVAAAPPDPAT